MPEPGDFSVARVTRWDQGLKLVEGRGNSTVSNSNPGKRLLGFTVLTVSIVTCGLTAAATGRGEELSGWMISGRIAAGLGASGREQRSAGQTAERWLAGVPESNWQYIVLHHSATDSGSVDQIHAEHRRRRDTAGNPWLGIGYHFVIGNGNGMKDGAIESTFRWEEQLSGAHSGHAALNARGIGVCLIGNFELAPPTDAQLNSVKTLVQVLATRHQIARENIVGHASVKATACPGKYFPLKELRQVIPVTKR